MYTLTDTRADLQISSLLHVSFGVTVIGACTVTNCPFEVHEVTLDRFAFIRVQVRQQKSYTCIVVCVF